MEYYAMLVSWAEFAAPYVTPESGARLESRLGLRPVPAEKGFFASLEGRFHSLIKHGREMDLPHFWFYSLAAALFYWPVRLLGLDIALCFMLLHVVLLLTAYFIIRRKLGPTAGLSLLLLVYFSPLFWFVNKVQVEFYAVVLAVLGVALLAAEAFPASAFVFALASTQNPPFAILAVLVFFFGWAKKKWAGLKSFFWVGAGLLVLMQPAYYYLRLGIINPVLATGAARIESDVFSLRKMFCFIVDPDIGLLANWPVAGLLLLALVFLVVKKRTSLTGGTGLFLIFSVPVLLWSQSRTMNLNHGGTYHISRYALWFLYVFFLIVWQIMMELSRTEVRRRGVWIRLAVVIGLIVTVEYWPTRPETYLKPTWASRQLYDRFPGIYDPMPGIFTERYRGKEENLPEDVWAVSNTSGNKILIRRRRLMAVNEQRIPPIETCPDLDRILVFREAKRRMATDKKRIYLYINGLGRQLKSGDVP
jgi:hypothetical protein